LNKAVSGIYRLTELAERALDTLIGGAIPCSSISVVLLDSADPKAAAAGKDNGAIGGTIGILAGAGAVAVPGLGRVIGAGIGIPEREAERCEALVRNGGTLLSVSCNSAEQVSRARKLLAGTGAGETQLESGDTRVA